MEKYTGKKYTIIDKGVQRSASGDRVSFSIPLQREMNTGYLIRELDRLIDEINRHEVAEPVQVELPGLFSS